MICILLPLAVFSAGCLVFIVTWRPLEVCFIPGAISYWLYLYWAEGMLDMIFFFKITSWNRMWHFIILGWHLCCKLSCRWMNCMLAFSQEEKEKVVFSCYSKTRKTLKENIWYRFSLFTVWNLAFCNVEDSRKDEWLILSDDKETHNFHETFYSTASLERNRNLKRQ